MSIGDHPWDAWQTSTGTTTLGTQHTWTNDSTLNLPDSYKPWSPNTTTSQPYVPYNEPYTPGGYVPEPKSYPLTPPPTPSLPEIEEMLEKVKKAIEETAETEAKEPQEPETEPDTTPRIDLEKKHKFLDI